MKNSEIVGCADMSIDSKGRLTLSKAVDADVHFGDEVVIILNEEFIEIRTSESVFNEMREIKEIIKNANKLDIIEYWDKRFEKLCLAIMRKTTVDKQGRVLFGADVMKDFPFKDVVVVGFYDSFRVYPAALYNEKRNRSK